MDSQGSEVKACASLDFEHQRRRWYLAMSEESVLVEWMHESPLSYLFITNKEEPQLCSTAPPEPHSIDFTSIPVSFPVSTWLLQMENVRHYVD